MYVMTQGRRERADAARNRRAILLATEDLLTRYRPEEISMGQVATAAGVGKGTLFHRFGSRMGLMRALMEERALALHESVATGPPPLGPGAPPRERLLAFLDGVIDVVSRNKGLIAALGHAASTAHKPQSRQQPVRQTPEEQAAGEQAQGEQTPKERQAQEQEQARQECVVPRGEAPQQPAPDSHRHPVYDFWHAHISTLITAQRPGHDAELLAHILLSTLYSEQIQDLLERGDGPRVAAALRLLANAVLDTPEAEDDSGETR